MNRCKCGCGLEAKPGNKYISGHNLLYPKPSTRRKMSMANTGKILPDTTREKMLGNQNALGHYYNPTPETREKIAASMVGKQNSLGRQNRLGHKHSSETKQKMSEIRKTYLSNPKNMAAQIVSFRKKPTEPEQILINIIKDYDLPFTYNGNNGKVIIDRLCPDFVHKTKPIVTLINGIYWHSNPEKELKVLNRYQNKGFKVITLTDQEIYNNSDDYLMFLLITRERLN